MKLRHLGLVSTDKTPDHILEEIDTLSKKLAMAINPLIDNSEPTVILGAICQLHAILIRHIISDKVVELEKAVAMISISLIRQVEVLSHGKFETVLRGYADDIK